VPPVRLVVRRHALEQMAERGIEPVWTERVALDPDWTEGDPQPGVARHFGAVPEFGGRILRVVVADRGAERHVLTVHFDRNARRRRP
jgi:Domain of unknown function (DUF4258)